MKVDQQFKCKFTELQVIHLGKSFIVLFSKSLFGTSL